MRKICNFIIKSSVYALVFLTPLFWLPWSAEVFEFNKQYLIFILIGLAWLAWLAKMVFVRRKIVFRRTSLDLWILVFAIVMILSAVFSVDKISSWIGFYGRFTDSVAVLLAVLMGYFIVVNNVETVKKPSETEEPVGSETGLIPRESKLNAQPEKKWGISLKAIFGLILSSAFLAVIAAYLSVFNLWAKISGLSADGAGLPAIMSFKSFNPVGGSLEALSIFLAAIIGLTVGMFLQRIRIIKGRKFSNFTYLFFCALAVFLLMLINFPAAWLVLGITMFVLLALALWTRMFKEHVNLLTLPIVLILISAFYWFGLPVKIGLLNELTFSRIQPPREVVLDYSTTAKVAWESLRTYPVLGSGPGTFMDDFAKFKPVSFNEGNFWNVRFDKAPSQLIEMVGTTGILGVLSYLMLIVVFALIVFVFFSRKKMEALGTHYSKFGLPLALAWLSLFLSQFFYYQNTVLIFYFWFFMALLMIVWQSIQSQPIKRIAISFKRVPEIGLIFNVFLLVLVFAMLGLFYLAGRFYWAEVKLSRPAETSEKLVSVFEQVANLNTYRENYREGLAQAYLTAAWKEANKPEAERNINLIQALATGSIQQAREATLISKNSVMAWENLGVIYRDSSGLVNGTLPFAIEAFNQARELEPGNPVFYREICRIRLLDEEADLDETLGYCQRAVDLKPNYLDANIQLALVYEKKGQLEEAVKQMESLLGRLKGVSFQRGSDLAGAATEIYFQLGRLHFNLNDLDKAIPMFEQAVIITPDYANARYALALSYANKGRKEDALTQLQILDQLVPNNENVRALIEQLGGENQN
ncbi:tetratricopeptide repeat protein [Patescibacteria group bacterium]|nr:tetratricopeptide repeat protein [Patescibacteria group bacterium]